MPTQKPRVTFTISNEEFARLEEYRYSNKFKNQTQAVLALIKEGLALTAPPKTTTPANKKSPALSGEALRLAQDYDVLTPAGQRAVRAVADFALSSVSLAPAPEPETKIIPLIGTAFAAGPAEPDTGLLPVDYQVPAGTDADFAVRVVGDSMEPDLHDGQIALCKKRDPRDGEVGAFLYNGAFLVKQYCEDPFGNVYLFSLNRAREDADVTVWAGSSDTLLCFGTVQTKKRPLPKV